MPNNSPLSYLKSLCSARSKMIGFSMTELMIVLVFIAIIAAIAVPTFTTYVREGHRIDAQTKMFEIANRLDTILNTNGRLLDTDGNAYYDVVADMGYNCIPENPTCDPTARYLIDITYPDGDQSYLIRLTALNDQTSDPCLDSGLMTLSSTNKRLPAYTSDNRPCWR